MKLAIDVAPAGRATVVRLTGELGLGTVGQLRSTVLKCLADEPSALIVELDRATVAAPVALGAFGPLARHAAQWPGVLLTLAVSDGSMRELLRHTALDHVVLTFGSVAEAVRSLGRPPPRRRVERELPANTGSGVLARRFVTEACSAWQVEGLVDDARMVTSELVENAVLRGRSHPQLGLDLRRGVLTIAVRDDDPARPEWQTVGLSATDGRDVFMVDAVARSWGYSPTWGGGKVVWAVLTNAGCVGNHP